MLPLVVLALALTSPSSSATKLAATDPLASARAAFAAGKYDDAKAAAADAAPGLAGAALEKLGDKAGACALYEKDRASTRAPAATLRAARCRSEDGDVPGALAAFTEVGASPLGDDPLVLADIAAFIDKHEQLPPGALARALQTQVGIFDDDRRNALATALMVLVERGDDVQKQKALDRLLVELPDTAAGKRAAELPEAQEKAPKDLPAALKRASALNDRHESAAVVALLEPMLARDEAAAAAAKAKGKLSSAQCEAHLLLGKTYRKLRKLSTAKKQLDVVAQKCGDDVKKKGAYLAARVAWISKSSTAATLLRSFADAYPDDALTDDVLLWLGDVKEREGDAKAAQQAWQRILSAFPEGDMVHDARFRLAWSRAVNGDVDGARATLDDAARLAPSSGKLDVKDRALYWRARLAYAPKVDSLSPTSDAKKRDAALSELAALSSARPASWYGELARLLLVDAKQKAPDVPGHVRDAVPSSSLNVSEALGKDQKWTLAQNLVAGGYDSEAELVLDSFATSTTLSAEDKFAVALMLGRIGNPGAGHALLRDAGLALLPGTPSQEGALAWSLDWPLAYTSSVEPAATSHDLPPALLYGLSREESAFDAGVVSWAGAVGLCQLMPPTASDEAKSEKLPVPSIDDLKDPSLNARLGASHLSRRMRGLKHPALAIAAYNAGPGQVLAWNPHGPVDTWVEQIPVDETRGYVKKVTGSWVTYAILDGNVDDVKFALILP